MEETPLQRTRLRIPRLLSIEYLTALLVLLVVGILYHHPWDGYVFEQTTRDLLRGITPYERMSNPDVHTYHGWTTPLVHQWWAYPPLPLLFLLVTAGPLILLGAPAWLIGLGVKLPAMLGVLASARLVEGLVLSRGHPLRARTAARWILWNPFFIAIAAVWGQFEPIMLALLLAAVLAMFRNRWGWAGIAFGLAVLIKPYVIFLAPLWVAWAMRKDQASGATRAAGASLALGVLVCLPFFLLEPQGFLQQVLGMHSDRPPGRFAPLAAVYGLIRIPLAASGYDVSVAIQLVSLLGLVAMSCVTWIACRRLLAGLGRDEDLVRTTALMLLGLVLSMKVLNEQYLVLSMGFLAAWIGFGLQPEVATRTVRLASTGLILAIAVDGLHLITFLRPEATLLLGHRSGDQMLVALLGWLGWTTWDLLIWTRVLAGAALLPLGIIWVRHGIRGVSFERTKRFLARPVLTLGVLVVLLGSALTVSSTEPIPYEPPHAVQEDDLLIFLIHTHYSNPLNDPSRDYGTWTGLPKPQDGFYQTNAGFAAAKVQELQALGADAVILTYTPAEYRNALAWMMVLSEAGIPHRVIVHEDIGRGTVGIERPPWHQLQNPDPVGGRSVERLLDNVVSYRQSILQLLDGNIVPVDPTLPGSTLPGQLIMDGDHSVILVRWNDHEADPLLPMDEPIPLLAVEIELLRQAMPRLVVEDLVIELEELIEETPAAHPSSSSSTRAPTDPLAHAETAGTSSSSPAPTA